jgi:hypothetical protein
VVRIAFVLLCIAATFCASATAASSATYCSPSGDVCYGITNKRGVIRFHLGLAARYFKRYRICVHPPRGAATKCRSFPVKGSRAQYGGSVRWDSHFPARGPGRYRVTWHQGTHRLGPPLSFLRR